jgi:hypothetical protein
VVGGIVVPALVWLVVLAAMGLARIPATTAAGSLQTRCLGATAAIILVIGVWDYAVPLSRRGVLSKQRADVENVVQLYEEIGRRSRQCGWTAPRISCNFLCDYLPPHLPPTIYERQHFMLYNRTLLPQNISAVSDVEALAAIQQSDFVIMNMAVAPENSAHAFRTSSYPFMKSMYDLRPRMLAECEKHCVPVRRFSIFGDEVVLYMRPPVAKADGSIPTARTSNDAVGSRSSDATRR